MASSRKPTGKSAGKSDPSTDVSAETADVASRPRKTATKAAAKASPKASAKAALAAQTDAAPAAERPKHKLVRDSFTIPKAEFTALDQLKRRGAGLGQPVKKSELLRAGLKLLSGLGDPELLAALKAVPTLKTGRPKQSRAERLAELTE